MDGYIKLDRKIRDWGWYNDAATKSVFIELLLRANWKEGEHKGYKLKPGQAICGRKEMTTLS